VQKNKINISKLNRKLSTINQQRIQLGGKTGSINVRAFFSLSTLFKGPNPFKWGAIPLLGT
jgi:hypothetical protein